ncbi:hypothetical protein K474DRAFT_1679400 [Panus rudis PR-1116 ss-1]|nr:hypothetical protein K474DRAFT_1679400 [Panus rudis PR-1116 ss-1]
MTPSLPQEIHDYIIDFLHDDQETLRACAIVHGLWTPTAHRHLFYDLSISWMNHRNLSTPALASKISFFRNSPTHASYVAILRIHEKDPTNYTDSEEYDPKDERSLPELEYDERGFLDIYSFIGILSNLNNVMFMSCVKLMSTTPPSRFDPPLVPTVVFDHCTESVVIHALPFFRCSQELVFYNICPDLKYRQFLVLPWETMELPPLDHLQSLTMSNIYYGMKLYRIWTYLQQRLGTTSITSLNLIEDCDAISTSLPSFWEGIGTNLLHLRLSEGIIVSFHESDSEMEERWRNVLSPLNRLLTLSIPMIGSWRGEYRPRKDGTNSSPKGLTTALKYASPTLQVVVIEWSHLCACKLDDPWWWTVPAALARFNNLRCVGLVLEDCNKEVEHRFREILPELSAENKLRFIFTPRRQDPIKSVVLRDFGRELLSGDL